MGQRGGFWHPDWKVGSSLVPRVMWVHAERHREGGPCASHHQLGSLRVDGQAEAKTIFLKKNQKLLWFLMQGVFFCLRGQT